MSIRGNGFTGDVGNWLRGVCMGAADIVPGVSGGTIALILGHYERLVTAISHVDRNLLRLLGQRRMRSAMEYVDFRFLLGLGSGIASGILALAALMHYLLENHQSSTYAVFTGLILGSSYLVAKRLRPWTWSGCAWAVLGACLAWQICVLQPMQGNLTPLTAFLGATVAICAMILPGISGAFVLLLLGLYHPVTTLIKGLPRGEITAQGLLVIACFGTGCVVGLLLFSRVLKWLLAHKHNSTLSFLCGLMLGSLYKIWPFQRVTEATAKLEFKERQFELMLPQDLQQSGWVIFLCGLALVATLLLEKIGSHFVASNSRMPGDSSADRAGESPG